ncbi:hypothetical protein MKS88_005754 [Plasmodium brasilianum]|nr:hypothetical protein MKS88_005754 [Plasmodium brasilianum]SBS91194.1 hypothetical protein PMALA_032150 [Plasmodium malariae]
MDQIEILKKNLNTEKVFYNLNWHELALDRSFDDSLSKNFENDKTNEDRYSYTSDDNAKNYYTNEGVTQDKGVLGKTYYNNDNVGGEQHEKRSRQRKKIPDKGGRNSGRNSGSNRDKNGCKNGDKISDKNKDKNNNSNYDLKNLINLNNNHNSGRINDHATEHDSIPSTPVLSYEPHPFSGKNGMCEVKKCNFIKEVKTEQSSNISFIPPVDILYDNEKVVFLFFISGDLENFKISSNNNYLTISGKKIPYDVQKCASYFSHEIKTGYFLRTYYFMKSIDKEKIHYEYKNGVMKILVYI